MRRKHAIALLLAIIAIAPIIQLQTIAYAVSPAVQQAGTGESILLVRLPGSQPTDPSIADAVVDALIVINRALYNGTVEGYMLVEDTYIGGVYAPRGSIILVGDTSVVEEKLAGSPGVEITRLEGLPAVRVLTLHPPKIGILDVGSTYTIHSVLREMGFPYTVVSPASVDQLVPQGYNVFILPPGSGTYIAKLLGPDGARSLAEYVKQGGGLIGVCAGAYAVIKGYNNWTALLQLVDGRLRNWPTWALGTGIVHVRVVYSDNPVVYGFTDGFDAIYYNGPVIVPYDLGTNTTLGIDVDPYTELVEYVSTSHEPGAFSYGWGSLEQSYVDSVIANASAVTLSAYGKGRIVLFAVHPELTSGDTGYAPNSTLSSRYNWRMLFNALYYVSSGNTITLAKAIKGAWVWPSTYRTVYDFVRESYPGLSEAEALSYAADMFAYELWSYGITDVFIEVKSITGYVFYPSEVLPAYPMEPYNTTNIYIPLIKALHRYGIRAHAWIPCFYDKYVWGRKDPVWHVGKAISDWKPYPVHKYVRPANTTYVNTLASLAKELLRMGFDGIHLDYIRYGHMVYSFSPRDIERAREQGINVTKVIDAIRRTFYTDYPGGYDPTYVWRTYMNGDQDLVKWFSLRRQDIARAIHVIAEAAREQGTVYGGEPIISAALMTDVTIDRPIEGYNFTIPGPVFQMLHYGQIYEDFAREGFWLIPMAYYLSYGQNITWVRKVSEYVVNVTSEYGGFPLVGIQAWSVGYSDVAEEEQLAIEGGAMGYVYFRWATYKTLVRGETWGTYEEAYDTLYTALPRIIAAASMLSPGSEKSLLRYYMIVDAVENGVLYPNPQAFVSEAYDTALSAANSILDELSNRAVELRQLTVEHELTGYAASIDTVLSMVDRARASGDLEQKTLIMWSALSALNGIEASIEQAILGSLEDKLLDLENRLSSLSTGVESAGENITQLRGEIAAIRQEIGELKNTSLPGLNTTITLLEQRLSSLEDRLDTISSRLDTLSSSIEGQNETLSSLSSRVDSLSSQVSPSTATAAAVVAVIAIVIAALSLFIARRKP